MASSSVRLEIPSVARQMDAGEHDLLVAFGCQCVDFRCDFIQRARTQGSARVGNDAVGTVVDAAVLNFERGARARVAHGGEWLKRPQFAQRQNFRLRPWLCSSPQHARRFPSSARAEHKANAFQRGDDLRRNLRVAPDGDDQRVWIAPVRAGDHLAGLGVTGLRDGAGVDNVDVRRVGKIDNLPALPHKQLPHGFRFVVIHLAAQRGESGFFCAHGSTS